MARRVTDGSGGFVAALLQLELRQHRREASATCARDISFRRPVSLLRAGIANRRFIRKPDFDDRVLLYY